MRLAWQNTGMSELALIMFSQVLGQPPSWQSGLWQPESVEPFMVARGLIDKIVTGHAGALRNGKTG